jgi:diacylglycerol kinase family enzyme
MATYPDSLLILNGKSAGNDLLRQAIQGLRDDGAHSRKSNMGKGDAARYINEALGLGVETIISGGGDGTINEIASALIDLPPADRPVMGILPLGTANDFATSAGIPEALEKALQLAISVKRPR